MVTIQNITTIRAMVCIVLDNRKHLWLKREDFAVLGWSEGMAFEEEELLHKIVLCQYPHALSHAVAMLARRPCSRGEIRSRLLAGKYAEEVVDLVMYKLEKEELVNDRDFSEQWAKYRSSGKYGTHRIRQELKMKGIPEDMAESALSKIDPSDESEHAFSLAEKLLRRRKPDEDIRKWRQKAVASLVRKGFDWELAKQACEKAERKASENCTA